MRLLSSWQIYALGSAFFAGLTVLFGKIGVMNLNSNLATFIPNHCYYCNDRGYFILA